MKKSDCKGNLSSEKVENNDSEDDAEDLNDGVSQRNAVLERTKSLIIYT